MRISKSAQTCALGAAIFGAVAARKRNGGYDKAGDAQKKMCGLKKTVYRPIKANNKTYERLFKVYKQLHDGFGTANCAKMNTVMKDLLRIKAGV